MDLTYRGRITAPDFPAGLDWINVDEPLSIRDLRGKIVLLDFWTQGCINCIHVIPDLKRLEREFPDELVVIGVHSAKFDSEGRTESIRQSVLRYGLEHPVVNDSGFAIWDAYAARAWPTTVLVDPAGKVVSAHAGEGVYDTFGEVVATMVHEWGDAGRLDRRPLDLVLEAERAAPSVLSFPGAVLADESADRLYIADSNHHRVLVASLDGRLHQSIGGPGGAGFDDGSFTEATFHRPQGLALNDDGTRLYVADLENHAIREVDLVEEEVRTVAGTGAQGYEDVSEPAPALSTAMSSPWDVLVAGDLVHIAMSGQHQLWTLDLGAGTVEVLAGTRREALVDGSPRRASLNQPSGLATDGTDLFFADAEASAVRRLPLDGSGDLTTIVGTGLFSFGDRDGEGDDVLLQHPVDLAHHDGQLYVTDTYNNKIKVIDPATRRSRTWVGSGKLGWADGEASGAELAEPSGISIAGGKAYIADTNNHLVRVADLATGDVATLTLSNLEIAQAAAPTNRTGELVALGLQEVAPGDGQLELDVTVPPGYQLNDLGPFEVEWTSGDDGVAAFTASPSFRQVLPAFPLRFPLRLEVGETTLVGRATVYYCRYGEQEFCLIRRLELEVPIRVIAEAPGATVLVHHEVPAVDI